jgi:hypothetical protein
LDLVAGTLHVFAEALGGLATADDNGTGRNEKKAGAIRV